MKRTTIFLFVWFCGTLFAAESDLRQVQLLSERGLFDAVEVFCNEKFLQSDFTDIDKILLTIELVRSYSLQLLIVEPAQQNRIVKLLESHESTWLTTLADSVSPDLVLAKINLRLQLAMAYQSLGDYQRLEADIVPETSKQTAYQKARSTLQDSIERLKKCQQELQVFRQRIGINADSLLKQRMLALEYLIMMQQSIAKKSLALTFSAEAERHFELRQAAGMLAELALINSIEPVIVQCKIEKAACHRLCGELDQCAEILSQLRGVTLTPECQLQFEAEWIRYQIAVGHVTEMRKYYTTDRTDGRLYPDFDLARLELFLTNDPILNIRPEYAAAVKLQQTIDRQLGSYWGRRARMTVSAFSLGNTELTSAEMLATLADNQYRENRFRESAELYEQAATRADASRQAENMFRYNRAAIAAWSKALEQLSPKESKIEYQNRLIALLRKLALQNPHHPEALQWHLSAIDFQGQIFSVQPEMLDDYLMLLKEHMEIWTESPQLQRIRRLWIILLERQGRIDEAAAMLPLLDTKQLETLTPEILRLRVRQLDSEDKTQEAVDILKMLLQQKREPATIQLLAEILTRQTGVKSLDYALTLWTLLAESVPKGNEMWWTAREGIIEVLCKSNRQNEAWESLKMLRILYPDLGGAERKERLTKQFGEN